MKVHLTVYSLCVLKIIIVKLCNTGSVWQLADMCGSSMEREEAAAVLSSYEHSHVGASSYCHSYCYTENLGLYRSTLYYQNACLWRHRAWCYGWSAYYCWWNLWSPWNPDMLMLFFLYSYFSIVGTAYVLQDFKVVSLLYHSSYQSVFFCITFLLIVRT